MALFSDFLLARNRHADSMIFLSLSRARNRLDEWGAGAGVARGVDRREDEGPGGEFREWEARRAWPSHKTHYSCCC
jgi:hypothetical protein